jgi:hypothetical protein
VRRIAAITVLLGVVVTACGSDEPAVAPTSSTAEAGGSDRDTTTTAAGDAGRSVAALPDDPCALLTADDVEALLGASVPGSPGVSSTTEGGPQFVSCGWGSVTDENGMVSLMASVPSEDLGIDFLQTVASAATQRTPVEVGDEGELLDVFLLPGGGGVGTSVLFRKDGLSVLVGRSGDGADPTVLETVAANVASRL